jgi:plastocyanin
MRKMVLFSLLVQVIGSASAAQLAVVVSDGSGKPVADAVVTVRPSSAAAAPPAAGKSVRRIIDQRNLVFVPYLQVVHPGDELVFRNSDSTYHHVYSFSPVRALEFVLAPGQSSPPLRLDKAGAIAVGCNIHDQMIAYVYVTDAPRFAQTGTSGRVAFEDVPAGDYEVRVWQPRLRPGTPEPRQRVSLDTATRTLTLTVKLLPDPRQRVDREHVHY